ncbi:hypothetical protein T11_12469, partial [Trichinella zimbabwensis]
LDVHHDGLLGSPNYAVEAGVCSVVTFLEGADEILKGTCGVVTLFLVVPYDFQLCETVAEAPLWKCFPESGAQRKLTQDGSCVRESLTVETGMAT